MAKVTLKNVNKFYDGNVHAVKDFNLEVEDKQFVVFVGPSGCGKSTTLRMIAGLEEISGGECYIGDRIINDVAPKDRDIAMVFQNYALYPHMTVYDNMAFGLKIRKFPKSEIDARVKEASDILGLGDLLNRRPAAMSGGQRQRVAMGRAIVRKPKVFLFDEPLSNLDAKLRVQMRSEISKLSTRLQTTMIYVTHDQVEAMTMGDVIVVMKDGLIQQIADPIELYNHPVNKFVAGFIGTPPMNFFNMDIKKEGSDYFVQDEGMKIKLSKEHAKVLDELEYKKEKIIFGIRPEDAVIKDLYKGDIDGNEFEAEVEVIEPLGAATYLYMNNGHTGFIAVSGKDADVANLGDKINMVLQINQVKLFDIDSEETIVDLRK